MYFDTAEIQPGAPRPKLPWGSSYMQFITLLRAYPTVNPKDFITFGILQEQPRRGTQAEWGQVAGVLSNMIGGRRVLVDELMLIVNRIQRLHREDPMRASEEQELINVLLTERQRSAGPLGKASFPQLEAPGGPLGRAPRTGLSGAQGGPHPTPNPSSTPDPQPWPSGVQGGAVVLHLNLIYQGPRKDVKRTKNLNLGPQVPRVSHVRPRTATRALREPGWPLSSSTWTPGFRRFNG